MENITAGSALEQLSYEKFRSEILKDYKIACISREASLLGRREVLTGKAKFGIFGDGKEIAQIAMAKFFQAGDWRSGYYRDQTFIFATGMGTVEQFFAQLYADPNHDPFSAGRQMNAHFATPTIDSEGNWLNLIELKNSSSDVAPTAGQMPRALGLALASKTFRNIQQLEKFKALSNNGNEICFCTIGDASTSEGHFWETLNAAGVLQVPLAIFCYDDGYGISVPKEYQTTKASISAAAKGFQKMENTNGIHIYKVKAWDYAGMCETFEQALKQMRITHAPALFHIEEATQPQGHSTSGSHERYKIAERLQWEKEWDGIKKMKEWILENALSNEDSLLRIENESKEYVKESKQRAWEAYTTPIKEQVKKVIYLCDTIADSNSTTNKELVKKYRDELAANREPMRREVMNTLGSIMNYVGNDTIYSDLKNYYQHLTNENKLLYNSYLYNNGPKSALKVPSIKAFFTDDAKIINGYEILNNYFDQLFATNPKVIAFGEDVGFIGDVNQGFSGLQEKYGKERIFDTGIRELTIIGQGIGLALRGLRPIAEIQYLDYLLYGLQPLSDDAATLHFRTAGKQSCPLIVRTRGHRLEGIWHSGSPMGMIINSLRGMYVCVPRNMVQAVGMYNTLLASNDPGLVIECLNGYRLKEKMPENLLTFTVPLGIPEVIREGTDITIVSYGSTLRIVLEATNILKELNISAEVIDVQTLLPFDLHHSILESLKKTNRILFVDEDVPGGGTAYMFNKVMEEQGGYKWLDASPRTLSSQAHRPAYGSDGDYFSKPNIMDIVKVAKEIMAE